MAFLLPRVGAMALSCVMVGACDASVGLVPGAPVLGRAVIAGLQSNRLLSVDIATGASTPLVPGVFTDGIVVVDADHQRVFARRRTAEGARGVMAVDLRTTKTLWIVSGAESDFVPSEGIAVSTDGSVLLVCAVLRRSQRGAVLIDTGTGRVLTILDNHPCRGTAPVAPSTTLPSGGFVTVGRRENTSRASDSLFILSSATREVVDSIAVPGGSGQFWSAVSAPDGSALFLGSDTRLLKYDLASRQITASVPRLTSGDLTIASSGGGLLLSDPGFGPDIAGKGILYEYDASLRLVREIDLRRFSTTGDPPTMGSARFTPDGAFLLVPTGTPERGKVYTEQRARLLVLNYASGALLKAMELNDWGAGVVLPFK